MIPNRLGLAARSFVVIVAAAAWMPPSAAAGALPVQSVRPSEPRNVTATASGSIVEIAWQAPTSGRPITRYQVELSTNAGSTWSLLADVAASQTAYTHRGLQAGATLLYQVRAMNAIGWGLWANPVTTTTGGARTPSAPLNLTATTIGSIVDLAWAAPSSDGGRSIIIYEIHVSVNDGAWSRLSSTPPGVTAYRDATASAGAVRRYRVRAWNAIGPGFWTNPVVATTGGAGTPTAPRNLTAAAAGPSAIDLDWDSPFSNGGSAITRYEIHVLVSGGSWSLLGSTPAGVTEYRDTHASAGTLRQLPGPGGQRLRRPGGSGVRGRHHSGQDTGGAPRTDGGRRGHVGDRA